MDSMWVQIPLCIGLAIPIVLLLGGSIYYNLIDRDGPDPDYRHISQMEHDLGLTPCSLKSCTTCYPKAVEKVTWPVYQFNSFTNELIPQNEYAINSLIQQAYNKEIEMQMRKSIYFDVDPVNPRRVGVSNGTHAMVIDMATLEAVGEEAVKDKFLADIRHSRNTKWEISNPLPPIPTAQPARIMK